MMVTCGNMPVDFCTGPYTLRHTLARSLNKQLVGIVNFHQLENPPATSNPPLKSVITITYYVGSLKDWEPSGTWRVNVLRKAP